MSRQYALHRQWCILSQLINEIIGQKTNGQRGLANRTGPQHKQLVFRSAPKVFSVSHCQVKLIQFLSKKNTVTKNSDYDTFWQLQIMTLFVQSIYKKEPESKHFENAQKKSNQLEQTDHDAILDT